MKRRSFLGFMAASPVAAQSIVKDAAAKMTGYSALNPGVGAPIASGQLVAAVSGASKASYIRGLVKKYLKTGLPAWKEYEVRKAAEEFRGLDPDIACSQSMSLSAKIRIQKKRNYKRLSALALEGLEMNENRSEWHREKGESGNYIDWF